MVGAADMGVILEGAGEILGEVAVVGVTGAVAVVGGDVR